jgi:hypothetical protein
MANDNIFDIQDWFDPAAIEEINGSVPPTRLQHDIAVEDVADYQRIERYLAIAKEFYRLNPEIGLNVIGCVRDRMPSMVDALCHQAGWDRCCCCHRVTLRGACDMCFGD